MIFVITILNIIAIIFLATGVYVLVKNHQIRRYIGDYFDIELTYSIFYAIVNKTIDTELDISSVASKEEIEKLLEDINEKIEYYDKKNIGAFVVGDLKNSLEERQERFIEMAAELRRWIWINQ